MANKDVEGPFSGELPRIGHFWAPTKGRRRDDDKSQNSSFPIVGQYGRDGVYERMARVSERQNKKNMVWRTLKYRNRDKVLARLCMAVTARSRQFLVTRHAASQCYEYEIERAIVVYLPPSTHRML